MADITNTLTVVGDSIADNSGSIDAANPGNSQLIYGRGFAEVANVLSGHLFRLIYPADGQPGSLSTGASGSVFAKGALYTEHLLSGSSPGLRATPDGFMAAAVASAANVIIVHIGTNNVNRGDTVSSIMTDLLAIWRLGTAAGKRVIATTILPRDSTVITGSKLTVLNGVNQKIRQAAAAEPGVYLCDWHNALLTTAAGAAPSGSAASAWFLDGLHPNAAGSYRMGAILAPVLAKLAGPGLPPDHLLVDPADSLTPNPIAVGNVAGVATSWTLTNVGTPTSITPTKVARTDLLPGEWQQVVAVAATADTDGFTLTVTDSTTSDWKTGDFVYAFAELQADAAGWDCRGLQLDVIETGAAPVASVLNMPTADRTALTVALGPAPVGGMTLITPRLQLAAGITAVRVVFRFFGSGTVRLGRMGVTKVQ